MKNFRLSSIILIGLAFICGLFLAGCSPSDEETSETSAVGSAVGRSITVNDNGSVTGQIFAMDTYMTITCYGDNARDAVSAAMDEIDRLDEELSVGNAESEISQINANGKGELSEDVLTMVRESLEIYRSTDGAFDITVYPLMELWGFTTQNYRVPSDDEITQTLTYCGSDKLTLEEGELILGSNQGIDLGGIAKGFTSDRLMEIFDEYGVNSAIVSLGGNVQCHGLKTDGTKWRCGIRDPRHPDVSDRFVGVLSIDDKAVITSGAYERYFVDEESGETYHHIIDPATGYPADNGLISVTVVSESGLLADGLSTACYVMGLERSLDYWRAHSEEFDLVLVDDDGNVYITEGLDGDFTSDYYDFTVVNRD